MLKKIYLLFSLLVIGLLVGYGLENKPTPPINELESVNIGLVEEKEIKTKASETFEGVVVEVNDNEILVYNKTTKQLEKYELKDFYFQESLLAPEVGALVYKTSNLWTVSKTYSIYEFYQK